MTLVKFRHKGKPVELEVSLRGRPRKGETVVESAQRKIDAAKKAYKAKHK